MIIKKRIAYTRELNVFLPFHCFQIYFLKSQSRIIPAEQPSWRNWCLFTICIQTCNFLSLQPLSIFRQATKNKWGKQIATCLEHSAPEVVLLNGEARTHTQTRMTAQNHNKTIAHFCWHQNEYWVRLFNVAIFFGNYLNYNNIKQQPTNWCCIVTKFREWEQNVYILRGTVADAPVKYIKRREKQRKKTQTI